MEPQVTLGVDVAQAGVAYHLRSADDRTLAHGRVAASNHGWQELTAVLTAQQLDWPACRVVLEATGLLHLPWAEKAAAAGAQVLVLNPLLAHRTYAVDNAVRDHKTDPIDAAGLAETGALHHRRLLRFVYRSRPAAFGLRRAIGARACLRAGLTNLRKCAGRLQALCFPELAGLALSAGRQRDLLRAAAAPAAVQALDQARLIALTGPHAPAVCAAAADSFAPAELAAATAPVLQALLIADQALAAELTALDRRIAAQAPQALDAEQLRRARTLPGFGPLTATHVLAYIPPELLASRRSRRARANALQAYFGCEPRVRTSGQWTGRIRLSKRGVREARTALFQAAFCALVHDADILAYYRGLRARGKAHKPALVDVMRKLLRRLVAVLDSASPTKPPLSP